MRQLALAALLALASTTTAARPPLECIAASPAVPTDGSFSLFPKQFHMISSTGAAQASTGLSTTVRSRCGAPASAHRQLRQLHGCDSPWRRVGRLITQHPALADAGPRR